MNNNLFPLSPTRPRLSAGFAWAGWGACLIVLGACVSPQSPTQPEASSETAPTLPSTQFEGASKDSLSSEVLGTFDRTQAECSEPLTVTRLVVTPDRLQFYYGFAEVNSVTFQDEGYDIDATLFHQEGQIEVQPEAVTYRAELRTEPGGQDGSILFRNNSTDQESLLVRCAGT